MTSAPLVAPAQERQHDDPAGACRVTTETPTARAGTTTPRSFLDHLVPTGLDPLPLGEGCATVLTSPPHPGDQQAGPSPLWLVGEVDLVTAPTLAEHLRSASPRDVVGPVVLDVSRVTFMDLAGLRMLLRLQTDLSAVGTTLVLRAPSPPVRLLLRVARPWATLSVLVPPDGAAGPEDEDASWSTTARPAR